MLAGQRAYACLPLSKVWKAYNAPGASWQAQQLQTLSRGPDGCLAADVPRGPLQATPTSDTAMFYFQTNKLGFGAEFLGRVRLVAALASLAGVGLFNFSLKSVPFRKIFLWTSVSGTVLGLSQLLLITGEPAPVIAPLQSLGGCRGFKGCKHILAGGEGIWGAGTQCQCARLALCVHWN